jgi:signal transduction histidine kinase
MSASPTTAAASAGSTSSFATALHAGSDVAIAVAALVLVGCLAYVARRRPDLVPKPLAPIALLAVAAFVASHLVSAVSSFEPEQWIAGALKAIAAAAAIVAAFATLRSVPRALALPRTRDLEEVNARLAGELAARERTQAELRAAVSALERDAIEQKKLLAEATARLEREAAEHRRTDQSLRYNETLLRRLHDGLEEHIAERTAELTKTISELEAFSYSISHDLRAPLRAINGYAAILRAEHAPLLSGEGEMLLSRIETNAARMAKLIDGLLDFARLGRVEVVKSDVDMHEVASAAVAEVVGSGDGGHAEIVVGALPAARGDPQMLRQVWVNLIANALKFSAPKPKPRIAVGGEHRGADIVYWVRDNGVGFDMAYAEKLFGVFHRLHRADEFPGVGVGLAIVRRIVTRHGGRVWAESAPGEGSTFFFTVGTAAPA